MPETDEVTTLEDLLDRLDQSAEENDPVTLGDLLDAIGRRSFGPLLLLAGLVVLAPVIGDIPGVPTSVAAVVFLAAIQLIFGRKHFWLPRWLLKRSISREKLSKALGWMRKPARFVDRLIRHRLGIFVEGGAVYAIAVVCIIIALTMPFMEVVPFSANIAGAALTALGLALIARDGLLALIAFVMTGLAAWIIVANLI
ncbi:MAG TPA: exopolysaccharide biosynthesis protein [Thermoanaerobaculia bacterium]|nr:exopolysaccharide biosynthesis protein [Thermoanaerobaculia bacterium]